MITAPPTGILITRCTRLLPRRPIHAGVQHIARTRHVGKHDAMPTKLRRALLQQAVSTVLNPVHVARTPTTTILRPLKIRLP